MGIKECGQAADQRQVVHCDGDKGGADHGHSEAEIQRGTAGQNQQVVRYLSARL